MEGTDKYTVRILRELATKWKETSIVAVALRQMANWLELYFERETWQDDVNELG